MRIIINFYNTMFINHQRQNSKDDFINVTFDTFDTPQWVLPQLDAFLPNQQSETVSASLPKFEKSENHNEELALFHS